MGKQFVSFFVPHNIQIIRFLLIHAFYQSNTLKMEKIMIFIFLDVKPYFNFLLKGTSISNDLLNFITFIFYNIKLYFTCFQK